MSRKARVLALAALAMLGACKQEDEPRAQYPVATPQPMPTPGGVPTAQSPTPAPGGVPAPNPAAPSMPPAFGFFCATDNDPQCPFGRCVGGRCGGCGNLADCKPGAQCVPSFVGQVCLPGATAPAPAPAPAPTITGSPAPSPPATSTGASAFEAARQLCVARTNEYRARVGVAGLARRADAEACVDAQARSDAASRTAHGAFGQCRERAQNECPGWDGTPEDVVNRCLSMMFAEGPGSGPAHGHYINMTDRQYSGVSCGFATLPSGELWMIQDYYP